MATCWGRTGRRMGSHARFGADCPWLIRPHVRTLGSWARYETLRCFGPITRANSVLLALTFPAVIASCGAAIGITSWREAFTVVIVGAPIMIGVSFILGPFGSRTISDLDGYNERVEKRLARLRDHVVGQVSKGPSSAPYVDPRRDGNVTLFAQEPRNRRLIAASTVITVVFVWTFLSTSSGNSRTLVLVLGFAQLLLVTRFLRSRGGDDTPAPRAHPHPHEHNDGPSD